VAVASLSDEMRRCVSAGVSADNPTALSVSAVGTDDFSVTLTVRGTSYNVRGNVYYPGQSAGVRVPFNTSVGTGGRVPIVFIAHGNHATFSNPLDRFDERGANPGTFNPIPNHKGYEYFQQFLAQMGIISVSVDCNRFNGPCPPPFTSMACLSSTNIQGRADLVLGAMLHFQSLNSAAGSLYKDHLDFSRVGLLGHSRGGEVVVLVPELLAASGSGVSGVTVKGVISLAPTDCHSTSGSPKGYPFMTILPAADEDVTDNDGAKFYDQAKPDPFKCQLYIDQANHNFFNREWVSDEFWSTIFVRAGRVMSRPEHEAILSAYGCAFFRTTLLGEPLHKFMEGRELPPNVRFDNVHISFERQGAMTVDDNEGHDIKKNNLGGANSRSSGLKADQFDFVHGASGAFNNTFFGNTRGMVARSSTVTGEFRWDLNAPQDLSGHEIWVRAAEVYNGANVPPDATGFRLSLVDAAGKKASADSNDVGGLPRPYDRRTDDNHLGIPDDTKTMLMSLRFLISCFRPERASDPKPFDPTQVRAIVLRMDRNDGRALAIDQLQIM
jgi:hypothetical protein